jgi:ribosomal protein S18 acetylase RimI-like enzyme
MIRKALTNDLSHIIQITQACARHMIAEGIFQWNEQYPSLTAFEKDLENDELYVLEEDGHVKGAIVISTRMDDIYAPIKWIAETNLNGYLHRLCVHPESQGKGYARKMLDFAEDLLKKQGCLSVRLDTFSKNLRNQRLYEARGYIKREDVYFLHKSPDPFHCYELVF